MRTDAAHLQQTSVSVTADVKRERWFDDESEWEYEYDEAETEDFFFTLDLTTHVPDALTKRETAKNGRWARGTMEARVKKASKGKPKEIIKPVGEGNLQEAIFVEREKATDNALEQTAPVDPSLEINDPDAEPDFVGQLQFVGLDTASPYLIFNDSFYIGYWLSDLGTQVWISRPGVSESVIRRGYVLDIIGASQARLMARPAKIQPRADFSADGAQESCQTPQSTVQQATVSDNFVYENAEREAQPLVVPDVETLDANLRNHASFMERFSALKWRRGEKDELPRYSVKQYEFPSNAEEIREKALAAEETLGSSERQRFMDGSFIDKPEQQFGTAKRPIVDSALKRRQQRKRNAAEGSDADDDDEEDENMSDGANDDREGTVEEPEPRGNSIIPPTTIIGRKRGRQRKTEKLQALGLPAEDDTTPVPKKKRRPRRTRQEMEADEAEGNNQRLDWE